MTRNGLPGSLKKRLAAFSLALAVLGAGTAASAQEYYYGGDDGGTYYDDGASYVTTEPSVTLPGKPTTLYNLDGSVYAQGYTTPDGQLVYDRNGVSQTVSSAPSVSAGTVVYDTGAYYEPGVVVQSSPTIVYETSPTVYFDDDYYRLGSGWGWSGGWGGWGGSSWNSHRYRPRYHSSYRPNYRPHPGRPGGSYRPRPPSPPRSGGRPSGGRPSGGRPSGGRPGGRR